MIMTTGMLLFLVACKDDDNHDDHDAKTSKNPLGARIIYDAIETGDVSKVDSILAKDAVDHSPMGDVKGSDSIKAVLADIHNHFKDLKLDIIAEVPGEEYGFTLVNFKGTCTDSSHGMPPGTKIDSRAVDVVRFKDSKVVEHWQYMDPAEMMKMAHKMPPPPPEKMEKKIY